MSAVKDFTPSQVASAIDAAFSVAAEVRRLGIHDLGELAPLVEYARAAEDREIALSAHRKALSAHQRFAATHHREDPAHEDHQLKVATAQRALNGAEQVLVMKHAEWRQARGL